MKDMYKKNIELINKAARMNGFRDGTEMQIHSYESKTFVYVIGAKLVVFKKVSLDVL